MMGPSLSDVGKEEQETGPLPLYNNFSFKYYATTALDIKNAAPTATIA